MTVNNEPRELLQRYCNDNDLSAFNRFYRQHSTRLWRFLRLRGCHEDAAYDLVAEAFSRFIKNICKDPTAPVALLYRIAVNLHIDQYRRDKTSLLLFDNDAQDLNAAQTPDSNHSDQLQLVRYYLNKLPQDEQNLLLMRYWIGLTHKEIAVAVDLPEGTVRRQAAAAIKKIRSYWQDDEA